MQTGYLTVHSETQKPHCGTLFEVPDHAFANSNYLIQHPEYELWHHNCVYFAKTVAEYCGLNTGGCVFDPTQLVLALALHNSSQMFNQRPYPWSRIATCCPYCPTTGPGTSCVD